MGRGKGGYTALEVSYRDSGGFKVKDDGSIFVGERYMDLGYEVVFRQRHNRKTYDLTIKTSDDIGYIKNIEVKRTTSTKPSRMAKNMEQGFKQVGKGGTVAIYLPHQTQCSLALKRINEAIDEARRKRWIKGPVEIWFKDKTKIEFNEEAIWLD